MNKPNNTKEVTKNPETTDGGLSYTSSTLGGVVITPTMTGSEIVDAVYQAPDMPLYDDWSYWIGLGGFLSVTE